MELLFKAESFDDRHVLAKHQTIYPDEETLTAVQDIVVKTEKALKLVSDRIFEEDKAKAKELEGTAAETPEDDETEGKEAEAKELVMQAEVESQSSSLDEDGISKHRELKGVMRIGVLAKGCLKSSILVNKI